MVQEREVLRVGANRSRPVDVRLICATHRDLRAEVEAGRFREDLYFRLRVIPIAVPPLRERREDILPMARAFLVRHTGVRELRLGDEAATRLLDHPFPGNVRELENAIQRAVVLCRADEITPEDLLLESPRPAPGASTGATSGTLQATLDDAAKSRIRAALERHDGARAEAARALGVDRTTLYRWMKRLGID